MASTPAVPSLAPDPRTLAQRIRAKWPGAYDDLDDYTLEQKVLAKYPMYHDLPLTQPPAASEPPEPGDYLSKTEDFLQRDLPQGFVKGAKQSVSFLRNLGRAAFVPGAAYEGLKGAVTPHPELAPKNLGEGVGMAAEQLAEMAATGGPLNEFGWSDFRAGHRYRWQLCERNGHGYDHLYSEERL